MSRDRKEDAVRSAIEDAIWRAIDLPWTEQQVRDEVDYVIQNVKEEGELRD